MDVPRDLKICLLDKKVNEGIEKGEKWSLVHGFPESIQEVIEFEEKVGLCYHKLNPTHTLQMQKTNYSLLLNCSAQVSKKT